MLKKAWWANVLTIVVCVFWIDTIVEMIIFSRWNNPIDYVILVLSTYAIYKGINCIYYLNNIRGDESNG
jgi:hypothetical protein